MKPRLAYVFCGAMRAAVRFWARDSAIQNIAGVIVGSDGAVIDTIALPLLQHAPNLTIAVAKKKSGENAP